MTGDPIDAAIEGLLAAFGAAAGLAGVQVVDGPPVEDVRGDVIGVGLSTEDPATDAGVAIGGMGGRDRDTFTVGCLAMSWHGDAAIGPRRRRTGELLAAVRAELKRDPTLGGRVTRARLAGHTYEAIRTGRGVAVSRPFRVAVDTFTR